ncbi:MAG: hypothetical protein E6G08_13130 [Actinobacteria bacterium]|nr:MAG: hypothetical protein E6G08_13130 [Actinomycetota bacterium]
MHHVQEGTDSMNTKLRLATLVAGALAGVALAGSALAAYTPTIAVSHPVATGGAHPTTIHAKVAQTDDPTAQVQIFAPTGYTIAAAPPSTTLGKASGTVFARDTGLTLPLEGTVVAADPAQYVGPPNNQCSPGTHFAVWLLNLSVAGQTIAVPIYVDPTTGTQAGLGAYKLVACFSAPDTPVGSPNHAPFGAQLLDANFTVDSAITLPASAGTYVWRSLFTPYTPSAGVPNAAGTVEARSFLGLPGTISIRAAVKKRKYTVSGVAKAGSTPAAGATVSLYRGATAQVVKAASKTATATGAYSFSGKLAKKKTTYFQTRVTVDESDNSAGCTDTSVPSAGVRCASSTFGGWAAASQVIRIRS